jgi:hypothetical protein
MALLVLFPLLTDLQKEQNVWGWATYRSKNTLKPKSI